MGTSGASSSFERVGSKGRRFFRASTVLQFRPERAAAKEDDPTQDVPLLWFGQPIDETKSKKERFVVLCARYECQARAGGGFNSRPSGPLLSFGLVAVTSSDRSAQPDNARAERHGTGQRKEILVEMQPTQFLNRSTTLSDSVFAIDCPHTNFELYSHQRWRCAMRLMKLSLF